MRESLGDKDRAVRLAALAAYQNTKDPAALPALLAALADPNEAVRAAAPSPWIGMPTKRAPRWRAPPPPPSAIRRSAARWCGSSKGGIGRRAPRAPAPRRRRIPESASLRGAALAACAKLAPKGPPTREPTTPRSIVGVRGGGPHSQLCGAAARAAGDERARNERLAKAALDRPGDAFRGRALFFDPAGPRCYACHQVGKEGEKVGPDLTDVGAKYGKRFLVESILEPSRAIHGGFEAAVFELEGDANYRAPSSANPKIPSTS